MSDPIKLAARLDLSAATGLQDALKARDTDSLTLDLSDVKHLGALCIQVIFAAATTCAARGGELALTNVSDRVLEQLRVMGLSPETLSRGNK